MPLPRCCCRRRCSLICAAPLPPGEEPGYDDVRYTRCNNNPSQEAVGAKIAALEGAPRVLY